MKQNRKAPGILLLCVLCLLGAMLWTQSQKPFFSASAAADLTEALESRYGPEYTGKPVENGTEDMRFEIESTVFLRNWKLRFFFGLDCTYECRVVITTHMPDGTISVRTITYQAVDPIGHDEMYLRASIDWDSMQERTE